MKQFDPLKIKGKKFVVIGDFLLDRYRFMQPKKLSPEAPVVVFNPVSEEFRLGGAANVANNLSSLGGDVKFFSVPEDWKSYSESVPLSFALHVYSGSRKITIKERVLTRRQQVCRIDVQEDRRLDHEEAEEIRAAAGKAIEDCDIVVMSDYNQGFMDKNLVLGLVEKARKENKMVVVDTKAPDSIEKYLSVTALVPSYAEAELIVGQKYEDDVYALSEKLLTESRAKCVGITMGPKGIFVKERLTQEELRRLDGPNATEGFFLYPYVWDEAEVIDVTGAGDTVLAATAAALACGESFVSALDFANEAAGQVVRKVGVVPVDVEQLLDERRKDARDAKKS